MKISYKLPQTFQGINSHNNLQTEASKHKKKINKKALAGSLVGTIIPLTFMLKKQKTLNPLKLEYNLKDMVLLTVSPITTGMLGGMINENSKIKKRKFTEGTYQLFNALIPLLFVNSGLKLCDKYKTLNNKPSKIIAVLSGITLGMLTAIKSVNKIFDPKDIYPDRKITAKDFLANIDDTIGALTLAKFPFIQKLHIDKLLPAIYTYCGYRAGK